MTSEIKSAIATLNKAVVTSETSKKDAAALVAQAIAALQKAIAPMQGQGPDPLDQT